jgi:uncharacterized protein YcnI/copper(I)-binding protein
LIALSAIKPKPERFSMFSKTVRGALGATAFLCLSSPALAHVSLETGEAAPNSTYKAVLRVPHGCAGEATRTVRVQIPEGVIAVKPMPKPGWTVTTAKGPYAKSYDDHGKPVSEGVKEIVWSGGELPDEHYDEFVFRARITDGFAPDAMIHFPVVQDCASRSERWTEVAAEGQDPHSLRSPAPGLRILASSGTAHAAQGTYRAGPLLVEQPWSRATPGGAKVAGGYLRITNTGTEPDRLVGGSSEVSGRFEVHEMSMADGIMRMRPIDGLVIPPGETVELKPGGFHAMLLDLKRPLTEGETVKGTLVFEKAGPVEIEYRVAGMGARSGAAEHKH